MWWLLYVATDITNDKLRATIRHNIKRELNDFLEFSKTVMEMVVDIFEEHHKHVAALKKEIKQRDDLILKYDRFQKTPSKKVGTRTSAKKAGSKKAAKGTAPRQR